MNYKILQNKHGAVVIKTSLSVFPDFLKLKQIQLSDINKYYVHKLWTPLRILYRSDRKSGRTVLCPNNLNNYALWT